MWIKNLYHNFLRKNDSVRLFEERHREGDIYMKIGLMHFRVGETDGVSLEMEKWKLILENLGHKVWYIAGSGEIEDVIKLKELHYQSPVNELLVNHIYKNVEDNYSEDEIKMIYQQYALAIEEALIKIIDEYELDMIVPNNILSLGWNIAAGKAVTEAIKKKDIRVIAHHHDFHWERELYSNPKYLWVKEILDDCFPPVSDKIRHVVINNIAQKVIKEKKNIEAVIVPNVFDYEHDWMVSDDYNATIRSDLGLENSDIVILQGTRIVARKGIELTLRSIAVMNELLKNFLGKTLYNGQVISTKTKIKLVCAGLNEDEIYYQKLESLAEEIDVELINLGNRFDFDRKEKNGVKIFSLWDAYKIADVISYPSLLEGFGNQLLEGVYVKKPLLIYEYPVYESYLKAVGLKAISFGNTHHLDEQGLAVVDEVISKEVAKETLELLVNLDEYNKIVQENYDICLHEFSYQALHKILSQLIE